MTTLHICRSPDLASRIRTALLAPTSTTQPIVDPSTLSINLDALLHRTPPLLASVYAETLRLHLQAYVTRASAHRDVHVAGWTLPRDKVCMVNTYASHMDESFWNTRDGKFPVGAFWAERFLIDPKDEGSGPVRRDVPAEVYKRPSPPRGQDEENEGGPFFSVQGLEGAWIPYGGGYAACPGRHFAKRIVLYTTALLVGAFEVEVLTPGLEMDDKCFGLGTQKPKHAVKFRIRRRKGGVTSTV